MFLLIFLGMNVGAAMFLIGFVGYALIISPKAAMGIVKTASISQATKYSFTVIPLFTLMGNACFAGGLSEGLYTASSKWLSRLKGNVACSTILASAMFGAICGSSTATASTICSISMPEFRKAGYKDTLSTGVICASGGLGILIPPSAVMIVYGASTEISIQKLFFAGLFPGILLAVLYMITIWILGAIKPGLLPPGSKCPWVERIAALKGVLGVLALFIFVLGGMFIGVFTINEAAAIGAFLSLVAMALKRRLTYENLKYVFFATIKSSGMIFILIIGATVFGNFLMVSGIPTKFSSFVVGLSVSRYVVLAIIFIIYAFLGCILDASPMMLITLPIFYPIIVNLGFDGIWFGAFICLVVNLGFITPPVGMNCYVVSGIVKDVDLTAIFRGSLPFCLSILAAVIICTIFPEIATWLPSVAA